MAERCAEEIVTVDVTSLMDTVKGLISKLAVKILAKRGLYASDHDITVFCNKTTLYGDLSIRKEFLMNVLKDCCGDDQQFKVLSDDIARELRELAASSKELWCYFTEITRSSLGHINIKLCRSHCFAVCIAQVVKAKDNYGTWPSAAEDHLYLFTHDLSLPGCKTTTESKHCSTELHKLLNYPVSKARGILLASLLCKLLMAAGITVDATDSHSNNEALLKSLICSPKIHPYITKQSMVEGDSIDVGRYLSDRNLTGKGGYSDAINTVSVRNEAGMTMPGHKAMDIIKVISGRVTSSSTKIIHIVHRQASHDVEKAIAVSLVATGNNIQHQILAHSGIKNDGMIFSQLLKARELSSMEACRMRYGNITTDAQLKYISSRIAEASIKFDLLSVDPNCQVKCYGLDDNTDLRSSGSFVLYNYARIAAIMEKFEVAVKKGTFSPLPDSSNIDFSLLTDESEWILLFQYIATYPDVIREAGILEKQGLGLYVTSGIKKLCLFLVHLAREFSAYYSRVKILLEPQAHLLPLMHARLSLVSCVKQILYNGLSLISVEPINQL